MIGSTETNRPSAGSYSRAPSRVSPVSALATPPTKPWLPAGHGAGAPRGLPKRSIRRAVTASVEELTATVEVPWRSATVHEKPLPVRVPTPS